VDDKLLKLLEPLDENEQALMKLDSIFKALDINTIQDIETLATYFIASNNTDLNSEYKQYNEKINGKLQSMEYNLSSQNSLKHGSRMRMRSHTISQGMKRMSISEDKNTTDSENKVRTRFRSHTISQGLTNIGENLFEGNKAEGDILGTTPSFSSTNKFGVNDDKRLNSSIPGGSSNNTINSKTSSNNSINNQKEEDFGLIDPSDTMVVIKRFLRDQKRNKLIDQISGTSENDLLDDDDFEKKLESIDKNKKKNQDNKLSNKAYEQIQKDYWERMTNIIDDKRYRLWKIVLFSMQKYNKILTERMALAEDIKFIKEQNSELKALLRQYMNAKVNDELEVPPTQIMLAQAGILRSPKRANPPPK